MKQDQKQVLEKSKMY